MAIGFNKDTVLNSLGTLPGIGIVVGLTELTVNKIALSKMKEISQEDLKNQSHLLGKMQKKYQQAFLTSYDKNITPSVGVPYKNEKQYLINSLAPHLINNLLTLGCFKERPTATLQDFANSIQGMKEGTQSFLKDNTQLYPKNEFDNEVKDTLSQAFFDKILSCAKGLNQEKISTEDVDHILLYLYIDARQIYQRTLCKEHVIKGVVRSTWFGNFGVITRDIVHNQHKSWTVAQKWNAELDLEQKEDASSV